MCLAPRSALVLRAPSAPNLLQRARRQNYGNGSPVLHDFNAAQRRDVVKESAEVVLRLTCRYSLHSLAILAKTRITASAAAGPLSDPHRAAPEPFIGARSELRSQEQRNSHHPDQSRQGCRLPQCSGPMDQKRRSPAHAAGSRLASDRWIGFVLHDPHTVPLSRVQIRSTRCLRLIRSSFTRRVPRRHSWVPPPRLPTPRGNVGRRTPDLEHVPWTP